MKIWNWIETVPFFVCKTSEKVTKRQNVSRDENFVKSFIDIYISEKVYVWLSSQEINICFSPDENSFTFLYFSRVANILEQNCGVKPGDVVMVILPRVPEWWLMNIACLRTGKVK